MPHHLEEYAARLRSRGFRMTPQRQMILAAIDEGKSHTTFDEIYERVQARSPAINRATVYRTLLFLCEQRLVVSADIGGQKSYEIAGNQPHHHLVCRSCATVMQINHDALHALCETLERDQGFSMDMDHLVIFGWCGYCRQHGIGEPAGAPLSPN
jgi:Fur family transcriptional regulator, ferric uptake regulator